MSRRRLFMARLIMSVGAERLASQVRPGSLVVFNYHRLRAHKRAASSFDDGVFGPDVEAFRQQMHWLKTFTKVLGEDEIIEVNAENRVSTKAVYSAVTFDDGYVDCFTLAKPVLDELGIRGIFFVPVEMLEQRRLGWWDQAAYLLKSTKQKAIDLNGHAFDIERQLDRSLRTVLNMFKLQKAHETEDLLLKLSEACEVGLPSKDSQDAELMTWAQVRELRATGHAVGSHSLSHRVLATLDREAQAREIKSSRSELQAILGCGVYSFAYPVGGPMHINHHSVALAREAGYAQAFTFNTGTTSLPVRDPYRIPRESANSFAILRAKVLLPRVMGLQEGLAV